MLTKEQNELLTQVGPGTPMGNYLRRYWHPIAGVSELEEKSVKAVRLFGENLVLYKDGSGNYGLIEKHCPHRGADLTFAMPDHNGLRCNYHGWAFDSAGRCISQPFDDISRGGKRGRGSVRAVAYPVKTKAGMIWAYMGCEPVPELPDWEQFTWENGFAQVVISTIPCNWLQCQENSIDPVHFEWMHENWGAYLQGNPDLQAARHLKLDFEEFEYGFCYRRIKEDTDENHENWTVGRIFLWPNAFCLTEHFEWRVPIDDENTLSVTWKFTRVPKEQEPFVQENIPTWEGPVFDENGAWIVSHVLNQDFLGWAGQGRIADRTRENLSGSDKGIVLIRRRFFDELKRVEAGEDAKGLIRDPAKNVAVPLPLMERDTVANGFTKAEIMANPKLKMLHTSYIFQAGQPEEVRLQFEHAMGLESTAFEDFRLMEMFAGSVDRPAAEQE